MYREWSGDMYRDLAVVIYQNYISDKYWENVGDTYHMLLHNDDS